MSSSARNELLGRVYIVAAGLVLLGLLILYKAFTINIVQGEEWRGMKDSLYVKEEVIEAERGNIYAEDGSLLATSLQFFDIRMDFKATGLDDDVFAKGVDSLALCLSRYVNPKWTPGYYKNWLIRKRNASSGNRYVLLAKGVSFSELEKIKTFPILRRGPYQGGLIVEQYGKRKLPFGSLAQRTIGYVRENAQDVGLESYFNEYLEGKKGSRVMIKVGGHEFVPLGDVKEIEPERGADIISTIDVNMQDIAHHALLRSLETHKAEWGTAVVMDVQTGAIRALANLSHVGDGKYGEIYNYAVGTKVEPGSTMKLASLMAMLEDQKVKLSDSVDLNRGYGRFCRQELRDAEPHNYQMTTVLKAFEKSSNVGMARLIRKAYGNEKKAATFIAWLRKFHLHEKTGIEIEGEAEPFIKDAYSVEQDWSCLSLPWISIGYEMEITPLQIACFYNAVANDGTYMAPYLIKEIVKDGEQLHSFEPKVVDRQIASASTIRKVQYALQQVVEEGTAKNVRSEYYQVAGKTGTTQVGYGRDKSANQITYQSSFVGYFPADKPKYTCLVMVYNPKRSTGYYGSTVAGPVFKEIADRCFSTDLSRSNPFEFAVQTQKDSRFLPSEHKLLKDDWYQIKDLLNVDYQESTEGEWVYLKGGDQQLQGLPYFTKKDVVPDVRGMALKDAVFLLENAGLTVQFAGLGKVESQSLPPGTNVKGQTINLKLG